MDSAKLSQFYDSFLDLQTLLVTTVETTVVQEPIISATLIYFAT